MLLLAYDDKKAAELESTSKQEAASYRAEGDKAASHLENLKKAVKGSNPIVCHEDYESPEEAAKMIYTELRDFFQRAFERNEAEERQAPEIIDHVSYLRRHAIPLEGLVSSGTLITKIDEYVDRVVGMPSFR